MAETFTQVYERLKKKKANANVPDEEIVAQAHAQVLEHDFNLKDRFQDQDEFKVARQMLRQYLVEFSITSIADKQTLTELIFYEVNQIRLQKRANEVYEDKGVVPAQSLETMHRNSELINRLKNSLGVNKKKDEKNVYDVLDHLRQRFKTWLSENQGSRTMVCPHCSKMVLLKMRMEHWDTQQHPFFRDRILYNEALFQLYYEQKITKEDIARVLECSVYYVEDILSRAKQPEPSND